MGKGKGANTFYHYMSPESFINMIEKNSLHFTNCMFLNDEEEYNYIFNVFEAIIQENVEDKLHSFVKSMKERVPKENTDLVSPNRGLWRIDEALASYYVLCGSTDGDSIPLWNYYVKDGRHYGYSVQMDAKRISDSLSTINGKMIFGKIIYDLEQQKQVIKDYVMHLDKKYNSNSEDFDDYSAEAYQTDYFDFIQHIRLFFKSITFRHENEFRIALLIRNKDKKIQKKYFARNGVITPYVDISFDNNIPIEGITYSRSIDEKIAELGIRDMLSSHSYDVKNLNLKRSDVKVRF